jgi:hypothetical protein
MCFWSKDLDAGFICLEKVVYNWQSIKQKTGYFPPFVQQFLLIMAGNNPTDTILCNN